MRSSRYFILFPIAVVYLAVTALVLAARRNVASSTKLVRIADGYSLLGATINAIAIMYLQRCAAQVAMGQASRMHGARFVAAAVALALVPRIICHIRSEERPR